MRPATLRTCAVTLALVALCCLQGPGLITADTKQDLVLDPGRLMAHGLLAWAPEGQFGQVQNQAYGYLWPMAPFFWIGHELGVPGWLVQRLWWALALTVGLLGMRLVLRRLGIGGPNAQLVGALAYVLAPRVLGLLGTTSVEAWPAMVLPWILLPLLSQHRPWRGAALSGLAMLMLGGVNAAASLAVLLVPLLWLLLGEGVDRRGVRIGAWLLAAAAATAWWMLPLLALRTTAFPFLDYIESAQIVGAVTSLLNVVRGADHWVAWSGDDAGPAWTAGYELAVRPGLVLATCLVAAAGLVGLAWQRPRIAAHRFLAVCLALGLVLLATTYAGRFGSPLAPAVRELLDGPLAPLRNVHKLDPLVRLPMAAGLAHLTAVRHRAVAGLVPGPRARAAAVAGLAVVAVVAGLVATSPFLAGRAASRGAFESIPGYWTQAAGWLEGNVHRGRVLVLPASNFGEYTWGRPLDEPLPSLARVSWVLRNAVPLGAPGAIRWVDGVDELVRSGRPSADLAPALSAAGISYVLLRHDLSVDKPRTPAAAARATVAGSPGFRRVAQFGPQAESFADSQVVMGSELPRELEVYAVDLPTAGAQLVTDPVVVAGGPEAAVGRGLPDPTWVAAADAGVTTPAGDRLATDTLTRRSQNFGAERGRDLTVVLSPQDDALRGRPAADISPFADDTPRPASRVEGGAVDVQASSSLADPFGIAYAGPGRRPFAALDGDPDTSWLSQADDSQPQLRLTVAQPVARLTLMLAGQSGGRRIDAVTARSGATERRVEVAGDAVDEVTLDLGVPSTHWTLTLERSGSWPAGIAEVVGLPQATREVVDLPGEPTGQLVLNRLDGSRRACLDLGGDWACSPAWATVAEEADVMRRTVPGAVPDGDAQVWVRARPTASLSARLDQARGLSVDASSIAFDDPAARGGAALDGDPATGWIPSGRDLAPRLEVRTDQPRTSDSFTYQLDDRDTGVTATLSADGQVLARHVPPGEQVRFPSATATRWTLTLTVSDVATLPLRVREAALGWSSQAGPIGAGCDAGLGVRVDGELRAFSVSASAGSLLRGELVPAKACPGSLAGVDDSDAMDPDAGGRAAADSAGAGRTRVESADLEWLAVQRVAWTGTATVAEPLTVTATTAESREVEVPAGSAGRVLTLAEGFNSGWDAQLAGADGTPLEPVRMEGWRQGWRLPATQAPTVLVARFAPADEHRQALLAGLAAALALIMVAAFALRSRDAARGLSLPAPVGGRPGGGRAQALPIGLVILGAVLAGPAGAATAALAATLLAVARPFAPAIAAGVGAAGLLPLLGWGAGGFGQLAVVAALATAVGAPAHEPQDGLLDQDQRQGGDPAGDDQREAKQDPEVTSEQLDAQHLRQQLQDQQMPQEDSVADPAP